MTRWSRNPYSLVLACIGAALVLFALGVAAVLASGHPVSPAFWAVGGAGVGILVGVLLPLPGHRSDISNSGGTGADPGSVPTASGALPAAGGAPAATAPTASGAQPPPEDPASGEPAESPRPTPPVLVVILALVAAVGLVLSGLFYARVVTPAACQLREFSGTPGCETQLLDFAAVLIFIASAAGGAMLGIYVPRPAPPEAPADESRRREPIVAGKGNPPHPLKTGEPPDGPEKRSLSLLGLAAIVAIAALVVLVAFVLLSLLPRATATGARVFNIGSIVFTLATIGLAVGAFILPERKRGLIASAVLTAVLAFVSSTASGLVVDRLKIPVTAKNYNYFSPTAKNYFSAIVKPPSVTVNSGSDCAVYLANLDSLVDDEPHVARHLKGRSLPLDPGAQACDLKRTSDVNALAAWLAER